MKHFIYTFIFILILTFALIPMENNAEENAKKDYVVTIHTSFGDIVLVLFDETPKHKENFLKLAEQKFYDGIGFHRILKNFMIQTGDPYSKVDGNEQLVGTGGPGYTLPAEINPKFKHEKGALAAARQGDAVNPTRASSGSQFYIVQNANGAPHLDGSYTIFGKVIKGLDVVDKIAEQPVNGQGKPYDPIRMTVTVEKLSLRKIEKQYGYRPN
jgi:cyclophilin family peptidyl-prolyl cis-trans isomerase